MGKRYYCDICGKQTICLMTSPLGYGDLCDECYHAGRDVIERTCEKQLKSLRNALDTIYGAKA